MLAKSIDFLNFTFSPLKNKTYQESSCSYVHQKVGHVYKTPPNPYLFATSLHKINTNAVRVGDLMGLVHIVIASPVT